MFGLFGKKKSNQATSDSTADSKTQAQMPKGYTPPKGAPTPTRKEAERARRRPLISSDASLSKEEQKAQNAERRARSNEIYKLQQHALRTGDEKHMPAQYRGKVRRWARDYVDASAPFSQWFMPVALLMLPVLFMATKYPQFAYWATVTIYTAFGLMTLQAILVVQRTKLLVKHRFGEDNYPRWLGWQLFARCVYLPNWRLPRPMVKRGEYPEGSSKEDVKAAREAKKANRAGKK
ncbi:MAG: DUF3043 domain-containing protein [Arcanobacterium sp.]